MSNTEKTDKQNRMQRIGRDSDSSGTRHWLKNLRGYRLRKERHNSNAEMRKIRNQTHRHDETGSIGIVAVDEPVGTMRRRTLWNGDRALA